MDFLFRKPEVKKPKPHSAFSEYLTEHQHEFLLVSCLLGAYATIKVLLLQHDMDRLMHETENHPRRREHRAKVQSSSDDER